ncbi:hypothetical protein BJY52DRAFT_160011 [Lactarius psammicola]|nr:hypothetical protein BJY52DRAFT_160011 [Lactarius psammicola]
MAPLPLTLAVPSRSRRSSIASSASPGALGDLVGDVLGALPRRPLPHRRIRRLQPPRHQRVPLPLPIPLHPRLRQLALRALHRPRHHPRPLAHLVWTFLVTVSYQRLLVLQTPLRRLQQTLRRLQRRLRQPILRRHHLQTLQRVRPRPHLPVPLLPHRRHRPRRRIVHWDY